MSLIAYVKTHHPKTFSTLRNIRSFLFTIMENTIAGNNPDDSSTAAAVDPQPPFDPLKPAVPISYPLKTLEELESRAYFKSFHYPFNQSAVKLPPAGGIGGGGLPQRPRMLVCHDMAGGYTDDKFVQGGTNADAYAIWHWYLIDVFVYFSHNLVTLPPPCWTNTAHRHGVKVLGTFIMEWDEGKTRADKLLLTKDSVKMYAERLTELAVALGFDGWLLNMEVTLDPKQIPNLKEFVSHLTQTMHSSLPGSLVIWYDSVTVDGALSWQNQLNDQNKPFFDICDGIFVNYTWEEDFPKLSADVAGDRKFDVYMGIDVFGRNTYGGGQWTTNVALDVIKKDDCSAAIFAPGWVYENKEPPNFQTAQNRWWGLVEQSWGTVQKYPRKLPFYSNFDQGHGYHIYNEGKQILDTPWDNISSQSFQPFIKYHGDSTTQPIQVSVNFKEASYSGGGNITFVGTLGVDADFTATLFVGELHLGNSPVHFTYSVKSSGDSLLGLALQFSSPTRDKRSVLLAASENTLLTMTQFSSHFTSVIMPRRVSKLDQDPAWVIHESSIDMPGHILKEIRALCYTSKPIKSADHGPHSLAPSNYYAVLGDIKIFTGEDNSKFPPANAWLVNSEFISWSTSNTAQGSKKLSVKLVWQLKVGNADPFDQYKIYVSRGKSSSEYLGVALLKSFYVSDLEVDSGTPSVKFVIQVCGSEGGVQKLEDSPFIQLQVGDS
ncbi:hypothetical protein ACS0TY_001077 [Phlomoides rotata]